MEIKTYFFDSYAFYEIINGNPSYKQFIENIGILTTKLNIMELYYGLLLRYNKAMANKYFDELIKYCIELDDETIKHACLFKLINKKLDLSYVDCIGYIIAKQRNVRFLTGDKQFENLENVEFVK